MTGLVEESAAHVEEQFADAIVFDNAHAAEFLRRPALIAGGQHAKDMQFVNSASVLGGLVAGLCRFERGVKDGGCILQGEVVATPGKFGTQRLAKNMIQNHVIMFDFDTGHSIEAVADLLAKAGLFAVLWTTHSHLKPQSAIGEEQMTTYLREIKANGSTPTDAQVLDFLRDRKKINPDILTDATVLGRKHEDGGVVFKVQHKPMPRLRALLVLKDPYVFADRPGLTQKQAIDDWKAMYAGFSEQLNLPYDTTCCDASRLMYTPRIADDAVIGPGQHEIWVIPGAAVDVDKVPRRLSGRQPAAAITGPGANFATAQATALPGATNNRSGPGGAGAGGTRVELQTTGLMRFLGQHGHDFEAADWLQARGIEPVVDMADGMDCVCPNVGSHTKQDHKDRSFAVRNASGSEGQGGFRMWCLHEGCKSASLDDRAWYLDQWLLQFGVTDVLEELLPFCPNAVAEAAEREALQAAASARAAEAQAAGADSGALEHRIAAFDAQTPFSEVDLVLQALATRPATDTIYVGDQLRAIASATGRKLGDLRKGLDAHRRALLAAAAANAGGGGGGRPLPAVEEDADTILGEWGFADRYRITLAAFAKKNTLKPTVFLQRQPGTGAKVVRIEIDEDGAALVEMTPPMWSSELRAKLAFSAVVTDSNGLPRDKSVAPFKDIVAEMASTRDRPYPFVDRIVRVPVFGPEGTLRTKRGYDHDLRLFFNPEIDFLSVPDNPTEDDIAQACGWLEEVVRDFPFSDAMDGKEMLPVKVGPEADGSDPDIPKGYREPNWERGRSSRVNMISAIILPFVRNMIDGPCPAYHIDKPVAGSGAGYLADVISIITEGERASAQPMAHDNDEFRKSITASLCDGAGLIFIDNLERKVDSGALAAALTAGKWRDRILGQTKTVKLDMKAMWLFAGNNSAFTAELLRRMVPIRIDPKVENATRDRDANSFLHFPLQPWLFQHRIRLIWACHVLIQNWIAKGMQAGDVTFHSFDGYARIMGGILKAAGYTDFLANIPDYVSLKGDDVGIAKEWAQACFDMYGPDHPMEFKDMIVAAAGDAFGHGKLDLPIRMERSGSDMVPSSRDGHAYIRADLESKTFNLEVRTGAKWRGRVSGELGVSVGSSVEVLSLTLTKNRRSNPIRYVFSTVATTDRTM